MLSRTSFLSLLAGTVLAFGAIHAHAQAREQGRLLMATEVLEELRQQRDQFIPDRLLDRAYGIAVVPDVTKVAFLFGGRRGNGVLVVRDQNGQFTNPIFLTLTGGSFGWQAGVQSADIVLVFTTKTGIEGITDGKLTLGADASVAAGPVGRQASASTDASFSAEVYSYSRTRGLFAGVALDGTALTINNRANAAFYGKRGVKASDILSGAVTTDDPSAQRFLASVTASTMTTQQASAPASGAEGESGSGPAAAPAPAPAASPGVRTFPMEDPAVGEEPPK